VLFLQHMQMITLTIVIYVFKIGRSSTLTAGRGMRERRGRGCGVH